ncbi:hypothetical protein [Leptothoe kymatousa]|uniref:Uncharacterized protein n=1 Tax=Leptothoe kymatousa TAU-MAC 1615 TaxID=2364775 RepID=A0ABS5Y5M8_9CYAN|nr:hypothetical protein [Leptothoe kymatousa]MBT9312659.1 hypothetical protein [Leptothoe kymatousa TAU-MAC 1615]
MGTGRVREEIIAGNAAIAPRPQLMATLHQVLHLSSALLKVPKCGFKL